MEKICSQCNESKYLTEFYKKKTGKNGLCAACKKCVITSTSKWPKENREKSRNIKKDWVERHKDTEKYLKMNRIKTKKYRDNHLEKCLERERKRVRNLKESGKWDRKKRYLYDREWIKKHPMQYRCYYTIRAALRGKKLNKPLECQICKKMGLIDGHHEDYNKPLDVVWCCRTCHSKLDQERRKRNGSNTGNI